MLHAEAKQSDPSTTVGQGIVINELMYHPASDRDAHEYVELTNSSAITVDLSGWSFSAGFDYTFPAGVALAPDGYLVVAHDPYDVAGQYGLDPAGLLGPFAARRLSNAGERVTLRNAAGDLIDTVRYSDDVPWPKTPDGWGPSLELINPTFENDRACAWAASHGHGTPGAQNSVFALDIPPCIEGVSHLPVFPTFAQSVTISAYIQDNGVISAAVVYHKPDGAPDFAMHVLTPAEGTDGEAGLYTAQLPPYDDGALVQFYVAATDEAGLTSQMPPDAPQITALETGHPLTRDYLYLVIDRPPSTAHPAYWLLVTQRNWEELTTRDLYSNEFLDATFVYEDEVYYNVGLRYRGESSRWREPHSFRINFPSTQLFQDVARLNLVGDHLSREALTYDLFRRAGMVASDTEFVDLYVNGVYHALYLSIEQVDEAFLAAHFPGDAGGNLYRAKDGGDLAYRGPNPDDYRAYYLKKTNEGEDDFSDVIALTGALAHSPGEVFQASTEALADMAQWTRWFALNALVFNTEGALFVGQGDDYFLYHRPSDDRFVLLPWDHDTTFYESRGDIWVSKLPIVQRILRHPPFTRLYYQNLAAWTTDEFSVATMAPLIQALPVELDGEKAELERFVHERGAYLTDYFEHNVPDQTLSITTGGGEGLTSTQRSVTLEGRCSPWRDVYVNGSASGVTYPSIYDWRYTATGLRPRANRFSVTDRGWDGTVMTTRTLTVTFDTFDGGRLGQSLTLTADASPHIIFDDIVVPPSLTLVIEPGATVALAEGVSLFVEGRLVAEGTVTQPITLTLDRFGAGGGHWGALGMYGSPESRLAHVLLEFMGQGQYVEGQGPELAEGQGPELVEGHVFEGLSAWDSRLTLRDSHVRDAAHTALTFRGTSISATAQLDRNWVHDVSAGLHVVGGVVHARDNLFHDLSGDAPGVFLGAGSTGAFDHNVVYGTLGDGLYLEASAVQVTRNEVHHCGGTGVVLSGTSGLTVVNNLIRHNGVGLATVQGAQAWLSHNTLVANNGAGLMLQDPQDRATVVNSILWDNGTAISLTTGAVLTAAYSVVQGGWAGPSQGTLQIDPQFRQPAQADFRLLDTSPCIDRGTPVGAPPIDLAGIARPKGKGYDLGAFEFFEYYTVYLPFSIRGAFR